MIAVKSRDGWCATNRKTTKYSDHARTICGMFVTMPFDFKEMKTDDLDCAYCKRLLNNKYRVEGRP